MKNENPDLANKSKIIEQVGARYYSALSQTVADISQALANENYDLEYSAETIAVINALLSLTVVMAYDNIDDREKASLVLHTTLREMIKANEKQHMEKEFKKI